MRAATLIVIGALSMATWAFPAKAAPMAPTLHLMAPSNIVQVWGGCGWGFHPTYWGGCVPNRRYYRPYWRYRHYGYYRPYWRYHHYWHRRW
jgi:hypothetical protein